MFSDDAVMHRHAQLTAMEAANLLGVSRPFLIKLLDQGKICFTRTGTHRRIKLRDIMDYKERRDRDAREALAVMAREAQGAARLLRIKASAPRTGLLAGKLPNRLEVHDTGHGMRVGPIARVELLRKLTRRHTETAHCLSLEDTLRLVCRDGDRLRISPRSVHARLSWDSG